MKKLILLIVLFGAASIASAQTVTCTVSGLTPKQTQLLADFLADVNAHPPQGAPIPFATFNAYCAWKMKADVIEFIKQRQEIDATKVGAQAIAHGDEVAPTAQCTAAGLAAGCLKAAIACVVLTGNAACN